MASNSPDLSEEQVHKLATFQDIAHIGDPARCIQILNAHEWNVEGAVNTILASGIPGTPGQAHPQAAQPHLQQNNSSFSPASQSSNPHNEHKELDNDVDMAPVANPNHPVRPQQPQETWFDTINKVPGGFMVTGALGLAGRVAVATLPTAVTAPFTEVYPDESPSQQFVREFTAQYSTGDNRIPPFFQGTHSEAIQQSARLGRYLFIYIHCSSHDDTDAFCRGTLTSQLVVDCLHHNFVCWGGDLLHKDAYQLASKLNVQGYPYYCVMGESPSNAGKYVLLDKHEGVIAPDVMVTRIHNLMEAHRGRLAQREMQRMAENADRNLRVEQDLEYQQALEADRQRHEEAANAERRRQEELDEIKRQEEEEAERLRKEEEDRQAKLAAVPEEPGEEEKQGVINVQIRLPDGTRVLRRFRETDKLQGLFNFIESHELAIDDEPLESYQVATRFPRQVFSDGEQSFSDAGLRRSASLFVEEKDV